MIYIRCELMKNLHIYKSIPQYLECSRFWTIAHTSGIGPEMRCDGMKVNPQRYLLSKYECFLISGCQAHEKLHLKYYHNAQAYLIPTLSMNPVVWCMSWSVNPPMYIWCVHECFVDEVVCMTNDAQGGLGHVFFLFVFHIIRTYAASC